MRSSSGEHFIALDHVRAIAAFQVFTWHFIHANGHLVPPNYSPSVFPLALLDEGHTGVALFMTLSGYLFAKLLDGKQIIYHAFLWNRALRLLPLLAVSLGIAGIQDFINGASMMAFLIFVAKGTVIPIVHNGIWSITIEFHFYFLLPLLLRLVRCSKWLLLMVVLIAIVLRIFLYHRLGEVQSLAYMTIIGRLDDFVLGMFLFHIRVFFSHRHAVVSVVMLAFCFFYWAFDKQGGFANNPSYPSPSALWIFLPTIEGLAYAIAIAWYDTSFSPSNTGASWFIAQIGSCSYSIYMLHFFFVDDMAEFVHQRIMEISNFYLACVWSLICFLIMVPIGFLSYRFVESPFLRYRKRYTIARSEGATISTDGLVMPDGTAK